jgi:phosphoribosyl 1,2-cyclic phosphodiesterase
LLASGSKGNATYIEENGAAILIDNGLSLVQLQGRAKSAGLELSKLKAVFITHEHGDHVKGVGPLARKYSLKVYASPGTMMAANGTLGRVDYEPIASGETVVAGSLKVSSFSSSHDATEPLIYVVKGPGASLGVAMDLGVVTHLIRQQFLNLTAAVIEFNHDLGMLINGPYHYVLKQRVRSRVGHLSNEDASVFLTEILHQGLKHVVLGHISETNNLPELALQAAREALAKARRGSPSLCAASQWEPTPVFQL